MHLQWVFLQQIYIFVSFFCLNSHGECFNRKLKIVNVLDCIYCGRTVRHSYNRWDTEIERERERKGERKKEKERKRKKERERKKERKRKKEREKEKDREKGCSMYVGG